MKSIFALIFGFICAFSAQAQTDYGRQYQRECSGCHGRKAEKTAFNKAPQLVTLSEAQIVTGMTRIRDEGGHSAATRAKAHLSDDQIAGLAAFIQTLKP
ncbi:c-type cytochrome [Entomohabitans teleogrylli]|uniref:c-type cytochrome n=1 Tax=Entomohabitans teleogrylli TaxID=1384589 RepID=UPI00073D2869|nr:c-type cytochrome [Entomohabitans teleogrylli]